MWASFLNSIIKSFTVVFQVFRMFFVWIFEHTWAFIVAIFLPLIKLFDTIVETVNSWLTTLDNVFTSEYSFSSVFDLVDQLIQSFFRDDIMSMIAKDCIYVFNFGGLFSSVFQICIPLLMSCLIYKVVKSWIPTVSGS